MIGILGSRNSADDAVNAENTRTMHHTYSGRSDAFYQMYATALLIYSRRHQKRNMICKRTPISHDITIGALRQNFDEILPKLLQCKLPNCH